MTHWTDVMMGSVTGLVFAAALIAHDWDQHYFAVALLILGALMVKIQLDRMEG